MSSAQPYPVQSVPVGAVYPESPLWHRSENLFTRSDGPVGRQGLCSGPLRGTDSQKVPV
jgi:hypothetical protein